MNDGAAVSPILMTPTSAQANRSVWQARQMFARTLSGWAMDVLALRRSGAAEALWRPAPVKTSLRKAA